MRTTTILGNSRQTGQMPLVPGWCEGLLDNGYVARRLGALTEYQKLNGCLAEVRAADAGELWLLCDAHARLAERIAVAEAARRRS